jgi:hypothetical protein
MFVWCEVELPHHVNHKLVQLLGGDSLDPAEEHEMLTDCQFVKQCIMLRTVSDQAPDRFLLCEDILRTQPCIAGGRELGTCQYVLRVQTRQTTVTGRTSSQG